MSDSIVESVRASAPANENVATDWPDLARSAAIHFCVFEHNVNSPMSDASLARLFFRHIPDAVKMDRSGKEETQCEARFLSRRIEQDMVVGRDYDEWFAGFNHQKPEIRQMFARGKENSLNPILDRLAEIGGFEREDILVREANEDMKAKVNARIVSFEQRQKLAAEQAAAMRSLGM